MGRNEVKFTLNGKDEEIGMGLAFSGDGFSPCGGVYVCVSFNRREKIQLVLGGVGKSFHYPPPVGYKAVGEAILSAVSDRKSLLEKEDILRLTLRLVDALGNEGMFSQPVNIFLPRVTVAELSWGARIISPSVY